MKKIALILIFWFTNFYSQDIIYTKSLDTIISKITEVDSKEIKYKKKSNIEGPTYSLKKIEIIKIIYSNGDIESYDKNKNISTIYVIRPRANGAWLNGMTIYENDKIIGVLSSNTHLKWDINPDDGEVLIKSKGESTEELRINPKPNKIYYIKQGQKTGWVKARPKIEFIDEDEALKLLKKTKEGEYKITQ